MQSLIRLVFKTPEKGWGPPAVSSARRSKMQIGAVIFIRSDRVGTGPRRRLGYKRPLRFSVGRGRGGDRPRLAAVQISAPAVALGRGAISRSCY